MKKLFVGLAGLMLFCIFPSAISQSVVTSYVFAGGVHEGDCTIWHTISGSFRMVPETCPSPVLPGTSVTIGGSMITAGNCISNTTTLAGAAVSMVALSSPVIYPGDSVLWKTYVSAPNTVTVKLCAFKTTTPITSTYNIRVIQ